MNSILFYDPCFKCPHFYTKQMCNMCEITLRRQGVITTIQKADPQLDEEQFKTYLAQKQKELDDYLDNVFKNIESSLEEEHGTKEEST